MRFKSPHSSLKPPPPPARAMSSVRLRAGRNLRGSAKAARHTVLAMTVSACLAASAPPAAAGYEITTPSDQVVGAVVGMAVGCVVSAGVATLITIVTGGLGSLTWVAVGTACTTGTTLGAAKVIDDSSGKTY